MYTLLQGFLAASVDKTVSQQQAQGDKGGIQVSMPCIICFLTPILNKFFTTGSRTAEASAANHLSSDHLDSNGRS